jgi:predicted small lipoprotein YifL
MVWMVTKELMTKEYLQERNAALLSFLLFRNINKGVSNMKKNLIMILAVLMILAITGCNREGAPDNLLPTSTPAPTNPARTLTPDESYFSDEPTIYMVMVNDEPQLFLKETHPLVVAVTETVEKFDKAYIDVDYRTLTGEETFPYLTEGMAAKLVDNGEIDDMLDYYSRNKLVIAAKGIANYVEVQFNIDMTECIVSYVSHQEIMECDEESSEIVVSVGEIYACKFAVSLVLVDGQWKINALGQSKLWRVDN